jgi:hypothetical protein
LVPGQAAFPADDVLLGLAVGGGQLQLHVGLVEGGGQASEVGKVWRSFYFKVKSLEMMERTKKNNSEFFFFLL